MNEDDSLLVTSLKRQSTIIMGPETPEITLNYNSEKNAIKGDDTKKNKDVFGSATPTLLHYVLLLVLALATWGLLWCAFGEGWSWDGRWFRLAVVGCMAWASGEALHMSTSLPPLLAALLTGIIARNVGFLDMRDYTEIDSFLRKIYPVIILGKGSLAWDLNFMKKNWQLVASLGILPWVTEVLTLAVCMHVFFDYPWMWGILLGSSYASVSCAILMPTIQRITGGKNLSQNWPQLICTAGGTDTALSVGIFGVVHSFMMHEGDEPYRYLKAAFALLLGVVVGASWGSLAKFIPHSKDFFVAELRLLFVLIGGLFTFFLTAKYGWGGTGGIAVLACNSTAAKCWEKDGWKINKNPASTAYRVMWSSLEPIVFAYSGTFFVIRASLTNVMLIGFGILCVCVVLRLTVAFLVCSSLTVRERFFVCCVWIPKSLVEAVLCPVAFNALVARGHYDEKEMEYAELYIRIIIQAILITTPIGYLLTNHLGPILLKEKQKKCDNESET
ncbi:sodium/hydrogen exchanger 9B2-like isoform X3 [Anticarsia gemmatalis]|uniref:sodium/hydrogen exchanger 9B2-like isoform X3 n=1 Tax=Anticarsia gemmatalis TaxID=129554 RepID=UPI003F76CAAF